MRLMEAKCELNALAEFIKFDIHRIQREVITKGCQETVLKAEGLCQKTIDSRTQAFEEQNPEGLTFRQMHA